MCRRPRAGLRAVRGRVSGAFGLGLTAPQTVSIGLGAALIAVVSYRVLLLVIAVVVGLAAALLASRPQTRHRAAQPAAATGAPGATADATAGPGDVTPA
ncbi:MAG TPA: hypothetical protein VGM53_03285 [Streptosporangiaceae bacterium]